MDDDKNLNTIDNEHMDDNSMESNTSSEFHPLNSESKTKEDHSSRYIKRYTIPAIILLIVLIFSIFYFIFKNSPNQKLVKAFVNTSNRINSDFNSILKSAGINQDFSKGSYQELNLRNTDLKNSSFYFVPDDIADGIKFTYLDIPDEKIMELGLELFRDKFTKKIIALHIDDQILKLGFPDLVDFAFKISSKNFGKDINTIISKDNEDFDGLNIDLSYSTINENMNQFNVDEMIKNYGETWETLFKDVELTVDGNVYTGMVNSDNIKSAIKQLLPKQTGKNLMLNELFFNKLDYFANYIHRYADNSQIKVEAKLVGDLVESSKITWIKDSKEVFAITTQFLNIDKSQNVWSDLKIGMYNYEDGGMIELYSNGEYSDSLINNKFEIKSQFYDESISNTNVWVKLDKTLKSDNLEVMIKFFAEDVASDAFFGVGTLVTDENSFSIDFPNLERAVLNSVKVPPKPFSTSLYYKKTNDISQKFTFKDEINIVELSINEILDYFMQVVTAFESTVYQ